MQRFMQTGANAVRTAILNRAALPASAAIHFVDDWEAYHLGEGEVHCATNVRRTPTGPGWWAPSD